MQLNANGETLFKPSRMNVQNKTASNGIYNEPVVKPSRIKSIVNNRNEKLEVQKVKKIALVDKNHNESLESAGNY